MSMAAMQGLEEWHVHHDRCLIVAVDQQSYSLENCNNPPVSAHTRTMCSQELLETTVRNHPQSELAIAWQKFVNDPGPKVFLTK